MSVGEHRPPRCSFQGLYKLGNKASLTYGGATAGVERVTQVGDREAAEREGAQLRREREHLRRLRINEAGVALAALLVSLTVIGVNAYNHRRGSQMVVLQPEQIALYREGQAGSAMLWLAVQVQMVNAAREYGDVVVNASASLGPDHAGSFRYVALVEPVISPKAKTMREECPEAARCVVAKNFYVVERPKRLLDVPGGSSRTEYLAFALESWNCAGDPRYCQDVSDYDFLIQQLGEDGDPSIRVDLDFQFDGSKTLECRLGADQRPAILDYLAKTGWAMPVCALNDSTGRRGL